MGNITLLHCVQGKKIFVTFSHMCHMSGSDMVKRNWWFTAERGVEGEGNNISSKQFATFLNTQQGIFFLQFFNVVMRISHCVLTLLWVWIFCEECCYTMIKNHDIFQAQTKSPFLCHYTVADHWQGFILSALQ